MIDINELRQSLGAIQPEEAAEILDRLEAAEKAAAEAYRRGYATGREEIEMERDELRAKVEQMEKQEPVGTVQWVQGWPVVNAHDGVLLEPNKPLYALPGAQNVPEKLCYDSRWEISIDYVDGWNAAIDAVRGKSPSWYCPDCCIVFPFGEPKSCPHDDARCNRALAAAPKPESHNE